MIARFVVAAMLCLATPAVAETVLIRDGRLHTQGPAGTVEHGSILIQDGVIKAVGPSLTAPDGARVVEAGGRPVTPGFIDPASAVGLYEVGEPEAGDLAEVAGGVEIADAVNFNSPAVAITRNAGVTRAVLTPGAAKALVGGVSALARLDGGPGMVVRRRASLNLYFGERAAALSGGSRATAWAQFRGLAADPVVLAAVAEKLPIVVSVDREADIRLLVSFAREKGWALVIRGGAEAWRCADLLAAARVGVIVHPSENLPARWESLGATLENAARLHRAGVRVVFSEAGIEREPQLAQMAGIAVAHGLPWDAGLAALTSTPAELWGVADRLGSLQVGREADVVIWDGDPLEVTSAPLVVLVGGKVASPVSRQTLLRDRYLK